VIEHNALLWRAEAAIRNFARYLIFGFKDPMSLHVVPEGFCGMSGIFIHS